MKVFYHDQFVLPLPETHRFPMAKYRLTRERVQTSGLVAPEDLIVPDGATDVEIGRVHSAEYLHKLKHGLLTDREIRRLGFPWSPQLLERSRRSVGSTIAACRAVLGGTMGVNLAGGTHHAHYDWGQGYCVLNDAVIAARAMQAEQLARRIVIIDLDVHQGNGTAALTRDDSTIFTFSIHGERNFPFHKEESDLDIALPDGTGDADYLDVLEESLWRVLNLARADLAIYLAGADPYRGDRLGRLCLSKNGLLERDRFVMQTCREAGLPLAVAMAGGYARDVNDIADIHFNTVAQAHAVFG